MNGVARGLKLGLGIPVVLLGLAVTLAGVVLLVLVGPDGRFVLPENEARSSVRGLIFDGLSLSGLPDDGAFALDVSIQVRDLDGTDEVFVGIGPRADVQRYLRDVALDRLIQANWPGGVRTERVSGPGFRTPAPPGDQHLWAVHDQGVEAEIRWPASDGDWVVLVMNGDASRGLEVAGTVEIAAPALGPASIAIFVVGLLVLAGGVALTVSGARMPARTRTAPPARPDATVPASARPLDGLEQGGLPASGADDHGAGRGDHQGAAQRDDR